MAGLQQSGCSPAWASTNKQAGFPSSVIRNNIIGSPIVVNLLRESEDKFKILIQ